MTPNPPPATEPERCGRRSKYGGICNAPVCEPQHFCERTPRCNNDSCHAFVPQARTHVHLAEIHGTDMRAPQPCEHEHEDPRDAALRAVVEWMDWYQSDRDAGDAYTLAKKLADLRRLVEGAMK